MMAIKPGTILAILLPFFLASVLDTTTGSRYVSRCCTRIEFTRLHRRYPLTFPRSNTEIVDLRRLRLALLFNLDDRRTVGPASSSLIFLVGIYHYTHDRRLQSLSLLNRIFRTLEKRSYFTQEVDVLFSSPSDSWMMIDRRDGR